MRIRSICLFTAYVFFIQLASGQDSTTLTEKIYQGSGTVNLLTDLSAYDLETAILTTGELTLAVDVNEAANGNESSISMGIALEKITLNITTSEGTYSFSDFYTNTTAVLENNTTGETSEYFTVFGTAGSNDISSNSADFDISSYDDVILLQNLNFEGEILEASLDVKFVDTGNGRGSNSAFFDYSNGFEDMALLTREDAMALEENAEGIANAPDDIEYVLSPSVVTQVPSEPQPKADTTIPLDVAPAAPVPPQILLLSIAGLLAYFGLRHRKP